MLEWLCTRLFHFHRSYLLKMSCLATIFISPGCDEILHYSQAVQRFLNRKDFPPASNTVLTQSFFYSPIPKNLVKGKSSQLNFRNAGATAKRAPEKHNFLSQILSSEDWNAPSPALGALNSKRMGKTLVLALQGTSKQTSSLTSCKQPHKPRATHTPGPHPLTLELTPVTHLCTLLESCFWTESCSSDSWTAFSTGVQWGSVGDSLGPLLCYLWLPPLPSAL